MRDKPLIKSKVTWAGIAAIVTAIGGFATGTLPPKEAVEGVFGGLMAIFFRDALRK